jgi:hypothetical protein
VTKHPHVGLEDAKTHLHDMLRPAYRDFTEKGSRANLVKVAEAAWAIHERLWHENGRVPPLTQFREDLFKACPELRLMRDIAETPNTRDWGVKLWCLLASRALNTLAGPRRSPAPG